MKRNRVSGIVIIFLLLPITRNVQGECTWGEAIHDALQARDLMVVNLRKHRQIPSLESAIDFMLSLHELSSQIEDLDHLDLDTPESNEQLISILVKQPRQPIVKDLLQFHHSTLEEAHDTRSLGIMIKTFQNYQNFLCIHALYSTSSSSYEGYDLPLDLMCHPIKDQLGTTTHGPLSPRKVCTSASRCSSADNPSDSFWLDQGTEIEVACSGAKCNINDAIPMMVSLLWYKVSDLIAQSLCHNHLPTPLLKTHIHTELQSVQRMVATVRAYFSTLTWDLFFTRAAEVGGYSTLETAMTLVTDHEKSFYSSIKACNDLDAQEVCIIKKINAEFKALKTLKRKRSEKVRDLRLFRHVNHAKLVELRKKTLKEIEALAILLKAQSVNRIANKRISNYFQGVSRYDERIAEQDFGYVKGKLDDFKTKANTLSQELWTTIKEILEKAITGLILDDLAIIAQAVNPLNLFEPMKGYDAAVKIAKKTQQIAKGGFALNALADVVSDSEKLAADFQRNRKQIPSMTNILDKIQQNDKDGVSALADEFIEAYGSYDPKVNRGRLDENDALWGSFKGLACELLFGKVEHAGRLVIVSPSKKLMCEKLDGTLAQLATLRGNIFDFQFELVDIIAKVVRGNIGTSPTSKASTYGYNLSSKKELFLGFLKTQVQLQREASTYCSKVEYMNQGQPIGVCKTKEGKGLFNEADLDELAAYNPEVSYHIDERFVYIPTRSQFDGDHGFIDLTRLKRDGSVLFTPPSNTKWLREFNWLASGETKAPFVESFKLYLPRKSYSGYLKTQVTLSAAAACKVDISSDVSYDLPLENTRYKTRYTEGYTRCPSGRDITNPYSLCENIPGICDTTQRMPGTGMMPTILTTWKLTYNMKSGGSNANHVWDAPDPATNLLIIGKLKLRYLPDTLLTKRNTVSTRRSGHSALGCCTGEMYRPKWNDIQCEACPTEFPSTSQLGGYYCETNP